MSKENDSIIKTKSVGKGFSKASAVKLKGTENSDTNLSFYPEIHERGVRGDLVRFKKSRNEEWESLSRSDFNKVNLEAGEKIEIELGTDQLKILIDEVNKLNEIVIKGVENGYNEYRVYNNNENVITVDDNNKKEIIEKILSSGYSDEFWQLLQKSEPSLADKLSYGHIQMQRKKIIQDLRGRLNCNNKFHETQGDDSWQKWIYKHNWLFGVNYLQALEKQKINTTGIMPDFLFVTTNGFTDVLEIKLPTDDVIRTDSSHNGSWVWTAETNKAIGQVVNYLTEIERLRLEIENKIKEQYNNISLLKPRAYILIGNSKDWEQNKKDGLRKLNYSLHGIEVITYQDLINRGELVVSSTSCAE